MAVQTEEVRELVDFSSQDFLVTSFYLDVNADEFPAPESIMTSFDSLMHTADEKRGQIEPGLSHEAEGSLRSDLQKIQQFIEKDFKRDDTNGVAIFSCSSGGLWEVIQTPTRFQSQVHFGERPYVAPLATFLSHTKPTALLLTDKQHARIFMMSHGDVKEWTDFEDFVPHRTEQGGWSQGRYQRRSDHWKQHHIDHADELVLKLEQHHPFDWVIVGAESQDRNEVVDRLHPYVRDRVIGFITVRIDAPEQEIVDEARRVREDAEQSHIDDLIARVQEYAGAGGRGTVGLEDTLRALNEQKVHILLVQAGYSTPGSVCPECGLLLAGEPKTCPACDAEPRRVDNIVDSAIQRAFELGSQTEVATEYEKLEPIGCIGSIMYY